MHTSTAAASTIVMLASLAYVADADARTITIVSGTYGANCGAENGNATRDLTRQCDGLDTCSYMPNPKRIGNAAQACRKDLQANWRCTDSEFHTAMLSPGAGAGSTLVLSCIEWNGPGH
ncbi:hypothetical protein [Caballeronia fortuita]|nr:hypothetical protein [Caballeronia fortuita]